MRRQAPCDLHGAIEGCAADAFVHQALPFGLTRTECLTHENVHERGWHSDDAWQPLRAAGTGKGPSSASSNPIRYSPSSAIRRSQASANSKAPARAVPEIAAITGFG